MERRGDTAAQGSSTARGGGHDSSLFEEREKELKEYEGQKGMKTGEVFSTCLMAEQILFWEAPGHLIYKQLMRSGPQCPVALGGYCWSITIADGHQVLEDHHDGESISEPAFARHVLQLGN